jgi:hypothetical protein
VKVEINNDGIHWLLLSAGEALKQTSEHWGWIGTTLKSEVRSYLQKFIKKILISVAGEL